MMRVCRFIALVLVGIVMVLTTVLPGRTADLIQLRYGLVGVSIPIEALQTFGETGTATALNPYLNLLGPGARSQLQRVLQATFEVSLSMVSQFTYTSSGEKLLKEAGTLIQTATGQNGFYSLRSAAILTAADRDGFSLLNFLHHLPTDMVVDLKGVQAFQRRLTRLLRDTAQTTTRLLHETERLAQTTAHLLPNNALQAGLPHRGSVAFERQTLTIPVPHRDRPLTVDLYLPQQATPAPVIVVSNGLGARRERFTRLASHLASHGFAILIPDHPGSDGDRLRDFYQGVQRENFDATEFVNRPLDITALLNGLEPLNQQQLSGMLNLQQVGVFGYSFGGTTALSLAGAEIQPASLETACRTEMAILNISLLYQCRALLIPDLAPRLRDERVKAVYAFLPFGNSLFGSGLNRVAVPVLWEASDEDFLTPLMIEQVPGFRQLAAPAQYFVLSRGLPHARINHEIASRLTQRSSNWQDIRAVSERYQNALTLAFFKTHLAEDDRYRPFLSAAYVTALAEASYPLSLVQSLEGLAIAPNFKMRIADTRGGELSFVGLRE